VWLEVGESVVIAAGSGADRNWVRDFSACSIGAGCTRPQLNGATLSGAGFSFTITGQAGSQWDVETTSDFLTWEKLSSVTLTGGSATFTDSDKDGYLLAYGGGYGNFVSGTGIGTTYPSLGLNSIELQSSGNNFVTWDSRAVFVNLYGSYFGSWDVANDFLRAPLANLYAPPNGRYGYGLCSTWGVFGLDLATLNLRSTGATIGESLRSVLDHLSQPFDPILDSLYNSFSFTTALLHVSLMGDPTLRLHTVRPASGLNPSAGVPGTISLQWSSSPDSPDNKYNIYRAPTRKGSFTLVNTSGEVNGLNYIATRPSVGASDYPDNFYMVRAVKTETTGSTPPASYKNMSEGAIVQAPGGIVPYLKIVQAPANQFAPGNIAAMMGEFLGFAVEVIGIDANGNENFAYQWFKNGSPVSNGPHVSGATDRTLLIHGVEFGDVGEYHVLVTGTGISAQSDSIVQPLAADDQFSVPRGSADLDVLRNDTAALPNGVLTIVSVSALSPGAGLATINPDGKSIHFSPDSSWPDSSGDSAPTATLLYTMSDGAGFSSARVTVRWVPRNFEVPLPGATGDLFLIFATEDYSIWKSLGAVTTVTSGPSNPYQYLDEEAGNLSERVYLAKQVSGSATVMYGFVRVIVPGKLANGTGGQGWIANPLNNLEGNTLEILLPNVPPGTIVRKYNPATQSYFPDAIFSGNAWSTPNVTLNPGEGAQVFNPTATPLAITFRGSLNSSSENMNLGPGYSLISSRFPMVPNLTPPEFQIGDDDQVLRWDADLQAYVSYSFFGGEWFDESPLVQPGEAFFFYNSGPNATWTQTAPQLNPATVAITDPADGTYFGGPANITLTTSASSDQGIAQVEFFQGTEPLGMATLNGSYYTLSWNNVLVGTYSVIARATDNSGTVTISKPIKITVSPLHSPNLSANAFQFAINGADGALARVLATDDFLLWNALGTVTLNGGNGSFLDSSVGSLSRRFYAVKIGDTYSPHQVGFYRITVPANTQKYIANQLNHPTGNTLENLFPQIPNNTRVYKRPMVNSVVAGADLVSIFGSGAWSPINTQLSPGEGARFENPASSELPIAFLGYVPTGQHDLVLPLRFPFVSSIFPSFQNLDDLGFLAWDRDYVFLTYEVLTYRFIQNKWIDGNGDYTVYTTPKPEVGESFSFVRYSQAGPWVWTQNPPPLYPPVVDIGSPLQGSLFEAPANISLSATATAGQGTITKVEFFQGSSLIGQGTPSGGSYVLSWNNVPSGAYSITAKVTDSAGIATISQPVQITVNTRPTISDIANQTINEDANTGALSFTIGDVETAAASLTVSASSGNTTLVPNANIVFGGSGANRTVTVTPAANQNGTATITVTVSDGSLSASDSFTLTVNAVNDAPTISDIVNQTIEQNTSTAVLNFTIGDVETAAASLTVTRTSSNPTLVPVANIVLGGSGANRTVTVTPAANQTGTATITVTVSDGTLTASDTFVLTVNAPTYLLSEGFDATGTPGYDNTGWTESGAANENYTTTILHGTQSLNCSGAQYIQRTFQYSTSFNLYFRVRWITWSDFKSVIYWDDSGFNTVANVYGDDNRLQIKHGSVSVNGTTVIAAGTTYHVWVEWTKGTGANGTMKLYMSTTGTKPASAEASITTGNGGATQRIYVGPTSAGPNVIFDRILVDDVPIGSNP
jgi:hypothetical protein